MATLGENKALLLLAVMSAVTTTVIVLSVFRQSSPLQEKLVFVVKDEDSPRKTNTVVIVTRQDEKVVACEVLDDENFQPDPNSTKSMTEREMLKALKECEHLSKTRQRREAKGSKNYNIDLSSHGCCYTENCTGASCDAKDCGGTGCDEEEECDDEESCGEEADAVGNSAFNIVLPGTKWCGAGDKAKDYDDLGHLKDTDKCCRAHDSCNDTMASGEKKHNLTNNSPFTSLNCSCDAEFYDCLSRVNSVASNSVGQAYFNILRRQCFKKEYPDSNVCKKYYTPFKIKCKEYEKNTTAPQQWVWKSAKRYKKLP